MGEGFVMAPTWKLNDEVATDTQALVVSGFGRLEYGAALFLQLPTGCRGKWLAALLDKFPATTAGDLGGEPLSFAISLSFTASGLTMMGLCQTEMASFSAPFREGMMQTDRLRRLGDRRKSKWLDTVIEGGPVWSGNTEQPDVRATVRAKSDTNGEPVATKTTVHAMVLLYAKSDGEVATHVEAISQFLDKHSVTIAHRLPLALGKEKDGRFSREHFGFADGISQPLPFDEDGAVLDRGGEEITTGDHVNGVRLGEILMGYKNGHQEIAPGPVAEDKESSPLPDHDRARGFRDLGKNGSYVVVRQLRQDVAAFWNGMDKAACALRSQDPSAKYVTDEWVAEKVVGRGIDGKALRPSGYLEDLTGDGVRNDFLYYEDDPHGIGCPLGSHVRRANPRDSLTPNGEAMQTLLDAANNHRILRRGRKYGPDLADKREDDSKERGLLFICLNTDIARQFEFTQQTWLLNSDFSTLFEETDPLIGPDGEMTIPAKPLRRRAKVETFVQMVGGEYFFLPSIPGLSYLASL